ncbi:MAG TPA: DUF4160 domain-containing protein [Blastocatellia bacterium]|nr:DUF4160 domain-containing protein [Blastocatellia bacterium]
MPEICRFYGIIIRMYFVDHPPPHFHAEYGEHEALITIENLQIFSGDLPSRAFKLVEEWASLHSDELRDLWDLARQSQPLSKIEPLQ